jgi:hypothetical protein
MRATYRPHHGWSAHITRHDGLRCVWRAAWMIEEGPYAGEMALVPVDVKEGPAWAPESELVDRE